MQYEEIIEKFELLKNPRNVEGMARFGIRPKTKVYGIAIPEIRKIAKEIKKANRRKIRKFPKNRGEETWRRLGRHLKNESKESP